MKNGEKVAKEECYCIIKENIYGRQTLSKNLLGGDYFISGMLVKLFQ